MFKVPKMLSDDTPHTPIPEGDGILDTPPMEPTPAPVSVPTTEDDHYKTRYLEIYEDLTGIPTNTLTLETPEVLGAQSRCPVYVHKRSGGELFCVAYVVGQIGDVNDYLDFIDILTVLRHQDDMIVFIDSPGGYVATGAHVASTMSLCAGRVTTIARGFCASAASLMWSAGHVNRLTPFSLFMYHMSSHGDMGNSLNIRNRADDMVRYVQTTLLRVPLAKGHITHEEMEKICVHGEDQYIDAKTMYDRIREKGA